jgi:hypothetical protein
MIKSLKFCGNNGHIKFLLHMTAVIQICWGWMLWERWHHGLINNRACNDHYHPSHLQDTVWRFVLVIVPPSNGIKNAWNHSSTLCIWHRSNVSFTFSYRLYITMNALKYAILGYHTSELSSIRKVAWIELFLPNTSVNSDFPISCLEIVMCYSNLNIHKSLHNRLPISIFSKLYFM